MEMKRGRERKKKGQRERKRERLVRLVETDRQTERKRGVCIVT